MRIRNQTFARIVLAGSVILPVAQVAVGQQPRPTIGQAPQAGVRQGNDLSGRSDANRGNQILRGSQIIGATVDLRGGSRFGTVSDFIVGDGGCVEYVIASYNNQYVPIPWAAAMYQPGDRVLLLDIDAARIHEMPMFRQFSELTNHQFSERVNTFYRGAHGQGNDRNPRGAANPQGSTKQGQPSLSSVPNRPAAGATQGTQGNRTGRSERGGDRR